MACTCDVDCTCVTPLSAEHLVIILKDACVVAERALKAHAETPGLERAAYHCLRLALKQAGAPQ